MSRGIASEVTVPFSEDRVPQITITGDPGVSDPGLGIPFRVYPAGCTYYVTVGTLTPDTIREVEIPGEMLSFSKSDSATLKYPPHGRQPILEVLWALNDRGQPADVRSMRFTIDSYTGRVKCSKAFTGLVKTSAYSARYQRILYKPTVEAVAVLWSEFPGIHVNYGVIAACKDGAMAIHEVQIPTGPQTGTDKVELWRVVSNTILDPTGEWEKPQTWGTSYNGKFNDGKTGPDSSSAIMKERVHEIGYATRTGLVTWYDQFPRGLANPYPPRAIKTIGTDPFQPEVTLRTQTPESLFPDDLSAQRAAARFIADRKATPLIR